MAVKNKNNEKVDYVFRIDDISINVDQEKVKDIVNSIFKKYPCSTVLLGVSALVSDLSQSKENKERIFPEIWNALSDFSMFYCVDKCGLPDKLLIELREKHGEKILTAGHGLIHVDHRLLSEEAQVMSIVSSCSLAKSDIFIPPFNKWNHITEYICEKFKVTLIKFEAGWKHLLYNKVDGPGLYYFHSHDFSSPKDFISKL